MDCRLHADTSSVQARSLWLMVVMLLVTAGAIYFAWPAGRPEMHLLLSKWCHGVSTGKIGYFLVAMVAGLVWLSAGRVGKKLASDEVSEATHQATKSGLIVIGLMLLGWLGSLVSCLWYLDYFAIGLDDVSYHWLAGLPSVNSVQHIHTSKSALAGSLDLLGLGAAHAHFDTGAGYAKVIPIWMQVWLMSTFVLSLVAGLWASRGLIAHYAAPHRAAAGFAWLIGWAWGSKCILDGGPLGYDALLSVLLMGIVAGRGAMFSVRQVRSGLVAIGAIWLGAHLILSLDSALWQGLRVLERGAWVLGSIILLIWLSAPARVDARETRREQAWWLGRGVLAACMVIAGGMLWLSYQSDVAPLRQPSNGATATKLSAEPEGVFFRSVSTGDGCVDCAAAYRYLGDQPSRVRRISLAHRRPEGATGMKFDVRPIGEVSGVNFQSRGDLELAGIEPRTDDRGTWLAMDVAFAAGRGPVVVDGWGQRGQLLENERFIAMLAADAYIQQAGIRQYVMVPRGFYARKPEADVARPAQRSTPP